MGDHVEHDGADPPDARGDGAPAGVYAEPQHGRSALAPPVARGRGAGRKGAEAEKAERRYRDLVEGLDGSIVWEANANTHALTFVSARAEELLGFPTHRWLDEPRFFLTRVHSADRGRLLGTCQRAVLDRMPQR